MGKEKHWNNTSPMLNINRLFKFIIERKFSFYVQKDFK